MDTWLVDRKAVAKPTELSVRAENAVDGVALNLVLKMSGFGWEQAATMPLHLVPSSAIVELTAGSHRSTTVCQADPRSGYRMASHATDFEVTYVMLMTVDGLHRLEDARDGRPLSLDIWAYADAVIVPRYFESGVRFRFIRDVRAGEWRAAIDPVLGFTTIRTETSLPTSGVLATAGKGLEKALSHRREGRHDDAVAAARVALDALGQAGFGGHAPKDVIEFIKQNAKHLTMAERFSAVQAALWMYCSPPHHAGSSEITKEDSQFAITALAALLKVAPVRGIR